jgi:hypothetical protein
MMQVWQKHINHTNCLPAVQKMIIRDLNAIRIPGTDLPVIQIAFKFWAYQSLKIIFNEKNNYVVI